jgi:hypothetical protein
MAKIKTKTKATYAPDYITLNGHTYEKISNDSVNVDLDLADDVIELLDKSVKKGEFVSRGDAIRSILRKKIEELSNKK